MEQEQKKSLFPTWSTIKQQEDDTPEDKVSMRGCQ